ncbi:ribose-phosphate diphosphokinase [Methanoregula sp.]|uniref:ribose-phosphate diphosphokinase n=1 Tax=Methanoregula sp. TaxID=2052170 RepID=UPI003BB1EC33
MKVISTEKSQILAARIATALNTSIVDVKFSRFPDGELYLAAGKTDDETIIVGSVTDSDALVQLLLLIDTCENSKNHLVIPYMGYARQDKRFRSGEPISARAVARVFAKGVEDCITVNIHEPAVLKYFDVSTTNLSLAKDMGGCIGSMDLSDPLILAPDDGALAFAQDVASAGGWDCDHLEKTRLSGVEVKMAPKKLCAALRSVIIVDDIISTGGTIATAANMLYQQGAAEVYAACVHGVLIGGAYGHLKASGIREVFCSDTIERGCSRLSAADCIVTALRG